MRYLMQQKWLAFGDDYSIKTADGAEAFFVDGRAISIGDKLSMTDPARNEVATIAQKLLASTVVIDLCCHGDKRR